MSDTQVLIAGGGPVGLAAAVELGQRGIECVVIGGHALRPNFGMVFHAPELLERTVHGPAVQYWILNRVAPALMGPIDLNGTWCADRMPDDTGRVIDQVRGADPTGGE
jgi:ribulose 1,5-bisphosphate synthetase/thiazole synthase